VVYRDVIVRVRLTEKEYKWVCKKAGLDSDSRCKNGKKNVSGYIRKCTLKESGYKGVILQKEIENLAYQIRKIGVNINQATKKLNSGYRSEEAIAELQRGLEQLNQNFIEVLRKLNKLEVQDGNHQIDEH
jgi:hypothetical protein